MKFTLSWLKEHLETNASLTEITNKLTAIGLELEGVEDAAAKLSSFTIAYVIEARQHPNADRLRVCKVDTGNGIVQVVCGAPNAKTGIYGVFAPVGSYIPGIEMTLKAGNIRGEASNGMLVSEREMELSDEHDGIIELDAAADKIGQSFAKYAGLDDPVIEIAITPNRGDCLGVYGIARDLAAAGLGILKTPNYGDTKGQFDSPINWKRNDKLAHDAPFAVGRYIKGVKLGPSPKWMQDRLRAIGLRPISVLVDITNYVTYDLGRPLHVFDADKIKGDLYIRYAKDGESILALDNKDYTLKDDMVIIADENAPESIAGIIGGKGSGCSGETVNVFVESALWAPIKIAETGRLLGIESDARYRFERGVDPRSALWGEQVGTRLVLELCGGVPSFAVTAGQEPDWSRQTSLRMERLKNRGGIDISTSDAENILKKLGFGTSVAGNVMTVDIPSHRLDIEGEHCLIEEILRIYGFDNVPTLPLERDTALPQIGITMGQRRVAFAKKTLATRGMFETISWSFTGLSEANLFGGVPRSLHIANPISSDLSVMRPSILCNLVTAALRNATRGYGDIRLFEVGPAFRDPTETGQDMIAAGIRTGKTGPRHWAEAPRNVDAFDVKADIFAVIEACGVPASNLQVSNDAPNWYHPGRSGALSFGKNVIAYFGEIHPKILKKLGLKGRAVAFEIFMERLPVAKSKNGKTRKLLQASNFQSVSRDFAFVVNQNIPANDLARAAVGAEKQLISNVEIFDIYQGEELGDKKSVAINVTIQPTDKTLTDDEIEAIANKVIANVTKNTGAILRS